MITTTYNYNSGSGFIYDPTKITFAGGMAELQLTNVPGQTFIPSISSSSFPGTLAYVGGSLEQVDQRPSTATYYASWTSQINANWSGTPSGSLTVTPSGTAVIDSGGLNLTGYGSSTLVTLSAANNIDTTGTGTIEFQITPNYSGNPSNTQNFLSACAAQGNVDNLINIAHTNSGSLIVQVHNSGGSSPVNIGSSWSPVSGTTYTLTLQYTSGNTTLLLNGVSFVTSNATYTRTGVTYVAIGEQYSGSGTPPNFWIKNFAWYSNVVTPATPVLSPTIYAAATAVLPLFTYGELGNVQAFTSFATTDANGVAYTVNGMYWNGSSWVNSNGSYSQASSASIVNSHIAALSASNTFQVDAIYPAGSSQASLNSLTMTYTGQSYPTSGPTIKPNSPLSMDSLSVFTDVDTHPTNSELLWYINIGPSNYWWNGSDWVISNGTFSQANFASIIQTNASSLPISLGSYVTPVAILYSSDGLETPTLTSITLTYDYFGPEPTEPNTCLVFGYIVDEMENPVVGAVVTVQNPITFINQGIIVAQGQYTSITDSLGYFKLNLIETETLTNVTYNFSVVYPY
jgi:hypothetical protein